MNIVAVVVTYNRLGLLKQNIDCLINQSTKLDKIIIVNNASTDGTIDYCNYLSKTRNDILVVNLKENTGGAGGFSTAIKTAIQVGADYIWGMDDDAMPRRDALEILISNINRFPKACYTSNTYFYSNQHELKQIQFSEDCRINHLTFVGFFIPRDLVLEIGYPRSDLFIYYDDLEYSMRILENDYAIIGIKDSIVEHPYIMPKNDRKVFIFHINIPEMPAWKLYYWMRNNLLIRRNKKNRRYIKTVLLEIYILIKIALFNPSNLLISCKGFVHGILNISGHLKDMP